MRRAAALWTALAVGLAWLAIAAPAHAQDARRIEAQILEKHRDAMARYDEFGFEEAKGVLREALALAAEHGLEGERFMARVYADLAVVYLSGLGDGDGAERALTRAAAVDPEIEIDPAYRARALDDMLAEIKRRQGAREVPAGGCDGVAGVAHEPVAAADAGQAITIDAQVSPALEAREVRVYFRSSGRPGAAGDYTAISMIQEGRCGFSVRIPAAAARGPALAYYIVARGAGDQALAGSGAADAPHVVTVRGGEAPAPVAEDLDAAHPRVFVGLGGGSAGAYLRGTTEQTDTEIQCCVAPELAHARVELGLFLTARVSVSAALRMGFPIGANLPGHAVAAPAALLRLRRASAPGGTGLLLSAVLGAGYARHTVKLQSATPGVDTDTAAPGPLLVGAGLGYALALAGPLRLSAELDTLVGVPVVEELAGAETVFGVHMGLSVALVAAF